MPTQLSQNYYVIDAKRVREDRLAAAKGVASYIIRGEQASTGDELVEIGTDFLTKQQKTSSTNLLGIVLNWLRMRIMKVEPVWYAREEELHEMQFSEMVNMVEEKLLKRRDEILAEGRAEGRAEGEARSLSRQRVGLLEMLAVRFGEIPVDWRTAVSKLNDIDKINGLNVALLKVKSPDAYGKLLMAAAQP